MTAAATERSDPRSGIMEQVLGALAGPGILDVPIAVIVAHPDDETIGIGGQLHRFPDAVIVHVTDGAPRDEADARAAGFADWRSYAAARRTEMLAAVTSANASGVRLLSLALPDKQVAYHLADIARRLAEILRSHDVEVVFTHPYEGGHIDHDATAFAVHSAAELIARERGRAPDVVEMASYHWRGAEMVPQRFAPIPDVPYVEVHLDREAHRQKQRMLDAFLSQAPVLARFRSSSERFRHAPHYDFSVPANGGEVGYRQITPEIDARRWLALAAEARLRLAPP